MSDTNNISNITTSCNSYRVGGTPESPECILSIHRHGPAVNQPEIILGNEHQQLLPVSRPLSSSSNNQLNPNLAPWSASARAQSTTPSDLLQMDSLIRSTSQQSNQQQICNESNHRMVIDGDGSYTVLILDCSPQPPLDCNNSCDCPSQCQCHCQTELIVKQQHEGCHHHHHHHSHQLQQQQQQQSQHYNQQEINRQQQQVYNQQIYNQPARLAITDRSSENRCRQSTSNQRQYQENQSYSPNGQREQQYQNQYEQQQQQRQFQQLNDENLLYINRNQQNFARDQDPSLSPRPSPTYSSPRQISTSSNNTNDQQVNRQTTTTTVVEETSYSANRQPLQASNMNQQQMQSPRSPTRQAGSPKPEPQVRQVQQSQQQQQPMMMNQPSPILKPGMRIVKRWDWNQAQFIYSEVPDTPAHPKPLPATSSHQHANKTTDVWHQQLTETVDSIMTSPNQNQQHHQLPSTSTSITTTTNSQIQQPWLAYKVPDIDSVAADPLYRDLMLELQRLEEGVRVVDQPVQLEPETSQKPVFGQSITPQYVECNEYETIEFVCRLIPQSDPTMRIEWLVNGKPLQESSRITNEFEFGVVRLRIKRCEAEDSGVYQCKAINKLGEAISTGSLRVNAKGSIQYETLHPAGLDKIRQLENPRPVDHVEVQAVHQAPKFLTHLNDYLEKNEGDSVHLECCLSPVDDPDLKTEWFFNGRPLVTGSRFHTIDDFGFIVLDIDWLFPRDTGEYVCRATNKHGQDITRTVLRVKPDKNIVLDSQLDNPTIIDKLRQLEFPIVPPPEEIIAEANKPAHFIQQLRTAGNKRDYNEGDNVHFEAHVGPANDGELTVEWYHNDKPLISGHRFKPTFDFGFIQLDILYVYPEDSGIYKCLAKNSTGQDSSTIEIQVQGKQSINYHTQLPKEMVGGVKKITDMEAQWNKPLEEIEEEELVEKCAPQFVLKLKPYTAFEGSCARFCCRLMANPRPRLTWVLNGQTIVSGSRYKLTHDGMYHLIIPKCQLSDAGKLEVYARNLLGECFSTTELKVKRKVDDYRGVLKNSPNPWYDEQSLKVYQRHRGSQDISSDDDEDFKAIMKQYYENKSKATEQQSISPMANQVVGYMEPGTPDVNLLLSSQSPLVQPGDMHPVVVEQQAVMAPAPSTISSALRVKDNISDKSAFYLEGGYESAEIREDDTKSNRFLQDKQAAGAEGKQVFGVNLPRYSAGNQSARKSTVSNAMQSARQQQEQSQQQQQQARYSSLERESPFNRQSSSFAFDPRLPPPSPESKVHGKEVHSHTHKQTQLERRSNKEIKREIIEKETFEQEHKGTTKDNIIRGSSVERGSTPLSDLLSEQSTVSSQQVLIEEHMYPPEFLQKIQPCQAIDGDEARFLCTFKGDPVPSIIWYKDNKQIKPSNLYTIITDLQQNKSTLIIKRVHLNCNAVFMVKAENAAGSAKSSANLVVEPAPTGSGARAGVAMRLDSASYSPTNYQQQSQDKSTSKTTTVTTTSVFESGDQSLDSSLSDNSQSQKVVKSIKTRKLRGDEINNLIRASPEGLIAPTFLHTIHDTIAKPGELCRLDARLVGSQPMEVKWLKNGERLRTDKSHKLTLEGDLYTLLILECSAKDEAFYECMAANRIGEARCGAQLVISDGRSQSSMSQHSAHSGAGRSYETTVMQTSTASSSSSILGFQQQQSGEQFHQEQDSSGQRKHFGITKHHYQNPLLDQYASNEAATTAQPGSVPKLIKRLENQQVNEGKSVTLRCQISSFPTAEVHWYKQGDKLIKPSKYFRIFKDNDETYCLKILETFPEDQGEYKCVAKAPNGKSIVETKASITVIPSSPR